MLRGKSLTAASGWKLGTVRLCDWPETGPWSHWMTEHQPECLCSADGQMWGNNDKKKSSTYQFCVCGRARAVAFYLHSDILVRQQSWWKPQGLTDPCSVSLSSSSFHPWNNCQRTENEMREESKQEHMKINETGVASVWTLFKGSVSKRCVSRTPTQERKTVCKARKCNGS